MEDATGVEANVHSSNEVIGIAKRRAFSAAYKRRIVDEARRARPGEIGLNLRREGLYFSPLAKWRAARSDMASKKRKSKSSVDLTAYRLLEKENARLKLKLRKDRSDAGAPKKSGGDTGLRRRERREPRARCRFVLPADLPPTLDLLWRVYALKADDVIRTSDPGSIRTR